MGVFQSVIRSFGYKTENDEECDHGSSKIFISGNGRSGKMQAFGSFFFINGVKALIQKFRLFFSFQSESERDHHDPIPPITNPAAPRIVTSHNEDPLLLTQALVISSSSSSSGDSSPEDESLMGSFVPPDPSLSGIFRDIYYDQEVAISIGTTTTSAHAYAEKIVTTFLQLNNEDEDEEGLAKDQDPGLRMVKSVVMVESSGSKCRWLKHYSSGHRILVVGDGDFSFSACLAKAFRCASNMIATSLDSREFLKKHYGQALSNLQKLKSRKCKVMHKIDATKLADHPLLGSLTFDRIVFNFPFAGFFKDMSRKSQIKRHRRLISQFLKNAKEMLSEDGEIHISHKTNGFHKEWKLKAVASTHRLRLIEAVRFNLVDYPGYNTKRGFGGDTNFNCKPSKTYKFGHKIVGGVV